MEQEELLNRYGIDLEVLKSEQLKLAKGIELKNKIDFSLVESYGAIDNIFIGKKILSCAIVCDKEFEIIDRAYVLEKIRFPYLAGFRNYRELEPMITAFNKLNEKPDVVFIQGHGIAHPRLGLASHFGLSTGIPTIGVSNSIFDTEIKGKDIIKENKKVGKILKSKKESNPMFVSPGNLISISNAYKLSKETIKLPHKRPEPIHLASKYAKKVKKELAIN
ncbi:endonuclease V [archaeon]|jgi:deoxyribonuclease V|nr:endonuclease V [archaeon]